jgi:dipeptidyl aminopeptidase/acylaminoacyl peptidase
MLQAAIYKPENFDPKKKYPMMIYIYERLSQGLHNHVRPAPGTSINISYYVSNGYIVMTPDIVYTVGQPGQSALKCVLPSIDAIASKGYIDTKNIGIQGHSWGGYQIAYMVTQTNQFKAAEAGAPVGNMTSAYSGIRWGSGLPRQFQYEKTQSRIGGTLWDKRDLFLQNSAVFYANKVNTPLLILHNDADDAVPWYQGIELFLALRRNGKEAYLLNYNGELHGLRKRINQKDYTVRMQQFFDYFLKGAPKPEWMEKGVPYLERDEEKKKFSEAYSSDVK